MNPLTIAVQHPATLSAADVLGVINSVVTQDAPIIVQTIPNPTVQTSIIAGEIGFSLLTQIFQRLHSLHQQKTAAAQTNG